MNFGQAIEALKAGKKVTRKGWNGKGMYLYLIDGRKVPFLNTNWETRQNIGSTFEHGDEVYFCPHIDMKAADNTIVIGWLASQTDMLSDDWMIV